MRLLLSWARDFVDISASADDVAEKLALRGFEVAAVEAIGADDAVIDFEVTANRPDCLSVRGLAREIAAAHDLPFRELPTGPAPAGRRSLPTGENNRLAVSLIASDLCPRYAAAVADVGPAASPEWMTRRLQAAGVRPISAIVDITNYVLMEIGHPMHAFDLAKLGGNELRIRRAEKGERIRTLDGVDRNLEPDMLVIADAHRAQAVAGVMGGGLSEVSETTRTVALESAYFKPASVRRTGKRLGLKTEASARFERGADVNAPVAALHRALDLLELLGAGQMVGLIVDRYPNPVGPASLHLRRARLALVLGLRVPDAEVERILRALALTPSAAIDGWDVAVPTFRVDLTREVDLIEEVGRLYGFDRIEPTFPALTMPAPPADPRIARDELVRRILTSCGFSEAVTFGFIEAAAARAFEAKTSDAGDGMSVPLQNPLSAKFDVLRSSLVPGLVDAVAHNRRHGRSDVRLFEIGSRFSRCSSETRGVGFAWTGSPVPLHWSGGAREVDFFDAKGVVEQLSQALGISARFLPQAPAFLAPGQSATVAVGDTTVGVVGLVVPALSESRGAPRHDKIFVAEIDLDRVWALREPSEERAQPLPRHPFVVRDISIIVNDSLPAEIIRGTIQAAARGGTAPLVATEFFDRYKGKGVPENAISLSARLTFQASDRTLTDSEVQQSVETVVRALGREHGAVQR